MHRAALAQSLLNLLTTPSRAETIAGDLAERAGADGRAFWRDLAGIASALFAHGVREAPLGTLWRLVAGLALWLLIYVAVRAAVAAWGLVPLETRLADCSIASLSTLLGFAATLLLSNLLAGACVGFGSGREGVNACVPLAAFWALTAGALLVLDSAQGSVSWYCALVYLLAVPLLYVAPLLGGGLAASRLRSAALRAA